jgi:predicted lipoprotein with Yx(FWY)xxD motif
MRTRTRSKLAGVGAALAVLALAFIAAGCGSSSNNSTSTSANSGGGGGGLYGGGGSSTTNAPASSGGAAAVVAVSNNPKLGKFLVDSKGNTLYYFENDKQHGTSSACTGSCASVWPAYTTSGAPKAQKGATASKLGTITGSGGSKQVTYNGWPLYTYTVDSAPGQTNGEDIKSFGGTWYVLTPAGDKPAGS